MSCAAVTAPTLAAPAMPTSDSRGFSRSAMLRNVRVPVTTTSAVSDKVSVTSTSSVSPAGTVTCRRAVEKFTSRNVRTAGPGGAPSMRYPPAGPLAVVSVDSPVSSSTITLGSTPPVSSVTLPATAPTISARAAPAGPMTITSRQTSVAAVR